MCVNPTHNSGYRIVKNPDESVVMRIKSALKENGGYCPCQIEQTSDTKCLCKDFHDKLGDPDFEGYCICGLYNKVKVGNENE